MSFMWRGVPRVCECTRWHDVPSKAIDTLSAVEVTEMLTSQGGVAICSFDWRCAGWLTWNVCRSLRVWQAGLSIVHRHWFRMDLGLRWVETFTETMNMSCFSQKQA